MQEEKLIYPYIIREQVTADWLKHYQINYKKINRENIKEFAEQWARSAN